MATNLLMVFSITKGRDGMELRGHYDGVEFIPIAGFCHDFKELYDYDFIQIYTVHGMLHHIPKRYLGNLERYLNRSYIEQFGSQTTLDV